MTDFWAAPDPPPPEDILHSDLMQMIVDRYHATPRNRQIELGPSEIGHPCLRRLAYGLTGVKQSNTYFDPLPSIVGTAAHTWMQTAAHHANEQLRRERWITEKKVHVAYDLAGSCDLYDADTATVVDWKFPGANRFTAFCKNMPTIYRVQAHLYGRGFINEGLPVKTVAVCLLPRGGSLKSMHLWSEPYSDKIADEAIARRETVIALCSDWDVENNPDRYHWFAMTPVDCVFCPQFVPRPTGPLQCQGDQ